jgi:hypothetical protein
MAGPSVSREIDVSPDCIPCRTVGPRRRSLEGLFKLVPTVLRGNAVLDAPRRLRFGSAGTRTVALRATSQARGACKMAFPRRAWERAFALLVAGVRRPRASHPTTLRPGRIVVGCGPSGPDPPYAPRFFGPKASGSKRPKVVRNTSGPSQTLTISASGPNSLMTWRQAPQGALGMLVGV